MIIAFRNEVTMNRMRVKNDHNDEFFVCGNNGCKGNCDISTYPSMIDAWNDGWIIPDEEYFIWVCPECATEYKN